MISNGSHWPHDEDGQVFDDPWMWQDPDELADQWRQGVGQDSR